MGLLAIWLAVGLGLVFWGIVSHIRHHLRMKKVNNKIAEVILPLIKEMIEEDQKPKKKVTKKSHE